jgi:HEPN domain-containing protein
MRQEIRNWLLQAKADLDGARSNMEAGKFYIAAFMSQQAVEKALKAVVLQADSELLKTHSVIRLPAGQEYRVDCLKK